MFRYYIENLNELSQEAVDELDILIRKSFPGSLTLSDIRQQYKSVPFSVCFVKNQNTLIFCSLLFASHPTLYLYYICVPKEFRSTGVFKRALKYLKQVFAKRKYTRFALDASEEKDAHMNQKKRINIFLSLGFRISPLKNPSPFIEHTDPKTYVRTSVGTGELVEQIGDEYFVLLNDKRRSLTLNQIKGCISDLSSSDPDLCPMTMSIVPKAGTRKNRI